MTQRLRVAYADVPAAVAFLQLDVTFLFLPRVVRYELVQGVFWIVR